LCDNIDAEYCSTYIFTLHLPLISLSLSLPRYDAGECALAVEQVVATGVRLQENKIIHTRQLQAANNEAERTVRAGAGAGSW
jgi:hypothetical protein